MQYRELLRLDVAARGPDPAPDMRLELGGRVTYDFRHGAFDLRADGWKTPSATLSAAPGHSQVDFGTKSLTGPANASISKHDPWLAGRPVSVVTRDPAAISATRMSLPHRWVLSAK
jgi:hypothetical protein